MSLRTRVQDIFKKKEQAKSLGTAYVTPAEASAMKNPSPSVSVVASQNPMNIVQKGNVQDYVKKSGGGSGSSGISNTPAVVTTPIPTSTTTPSQSAQQQAEQRNQLTSAERNAVLRRIELTRSANDRGRAYTRLEAERFMGGAKGVSNLRRGTAKGYRYQDAEIIQSAEIPAQTLVSTRSASETDRTSFFNKVGNRIKSSDTYGSFFSGVMEDAKVSYPNLNTNIGKVKDYGKSLVGFGIPNTPYFVPISAIPTDKVTNLYGDFQNWKSQDRSVNVFGKEVHLIRSPEWYETSRGQRFSQSVNLLFTTAMVTPAGIGRQVIVETFPLRATEKAYATEFIETKIVGGVPIRQGEYKIFSEVAPPRVRITTTLNRASMGKPAYEIKYFDSIMKTTTTPFKAVADQPFITFTGKSSKTIQASQVSAISERLEIGSYPNQLSQNQRYLVEKMASAKADNTPQLAEFIPKLYNKNNLYFSSNIQVEQLATLKPYQKNIKYKIFNRKISGKDNFGSAFKDKRPLEVSSLTKGGEGTATTRFEALTEVKQIKETDLYEYSVSNILFKDTTFPNGRSAGKTPSLKVFTTETKMLNVDDLTSGVEVNRLYSNKKTPFATTFQTQQTKQFFPKPPPPITPKTMITTRTISPTKITPQTFTATSSLYAGTGLYERSSGGSLPGQSFSTSSSLKDFELNKSVTTLVSTPQYKGLTKSFTKNIPKNINKEITKPMTKEVTKTIQKPMLKIIQKPMQKLLQKPMQKPMLFVTPARPGTPRTKGVFGFLKLRGKKQYGGFGKYGVRIKRFGTFRNIGSGLSLKSAFKMGTQATQGSLARTFSVTGGSLAGGKIPKGYKIKKGKEGLLFIEPSSQALNVATETKALNFYKQQKKVKKKKKKQKGGNK